MRKYLSVLVMGGAMLLAGGSLLLAQQGQGGRGQTLTGVVTDSMCGATHKMPDAVKCTLGCTSHGAGFALLVGDKVYTLEGKTEGIEKLAGAKAKVTGRVDGDKITVRSIEAAS